MTLLLAKQNSKNELTFVDTISGPIRMVGFHSKSSVQDNYTVCGMPLRQKNKISLFSAVPTS